MLVGGVGACTCSWAQFLLYLAYLESKAQFLEKQSAKKLRTLCLLELMIFIKCQVHSS